MVCDAEMPYSVGASRFVVEVVLKEEVVAADARACCQRVCKEPSLERMRDSRMVVEMDFPTVTVSKRGSEDQRCETPPSFIAQVVYLLRARAMWYCGRRCGARVIIESRTKAPRSRSALSAN